LITDSELIRCAIFYHNTIKICSNNYGKYPTELFNTINFADKMETVLPVVPGLLACSYQWEKDGAAISGATSERYTRPNATEADSGDYRVALTNSVGKLTSAIAHVSVRVTPPSSTLLTNAATPGGTVTRRKNPDSFIAGDTVSLIAHVAAGYRFNGWGGDTAAAARSGDRYLLKLDGSGNKMWDRTFGDAYDDHGYCAQQTADGGYVIVGETRNAGGVADVILVKTDDMGKVYLFGFPFSLRLKNRT
jgi:hypothetical protein